MMTIYPEAAQFKTLYESGQAQLVWQWMSSDLETPVSAYLKVCGHAPNSFLLESVEGGATLGRYSVIGTRPDFLWRCTKGVVETCDGKTAYWKPYEEDNALDSLRKAIQNSSIETLPDGLPPMCTLGLFGYIGYDMIRHIEAIPDQNPDDLDLPDSLLMRPSIMIIFDNVKQQICIATPVYTDNTRSADEAYMKAKQRLTQITDTLSKPLDQNLLTHKTTLSPDQKPVSNTAEPHYKESVNKAIEYIYAGDIFQVVLSQRFTMAYDLPPFELYRALRSLNPSPFLFYLSFDGFSLVGSSPEILVRVRDDIVTIRPIAGTRKRGETIQEDQRLEAELLADPKERSEHLMLVDLGRNDVGRVAKIGTVEVTEQFQIERYSHVMHIVSNVNGELREDIDPLDAFFAGFPAGTVSGAPKIRAMEIIDELEVGRRGTYAGGIGRFSSKSIDSCIALRTALVKDGKIHVQAGGGVVADSVPELEHQECQNKAKAVLKAAERTIKKFQS
ncbi:MAG: anthranilate synthase component I [Alphaproteobacteria bacterium]